MARPSFARRQIVLLAGDYQARKIVSGLGREASESVRRVATREDAVIAAMLDDCLLIVEDAHWVGVSSAQADRLRERRKVGALKILVLSGEPVDQAATASGPINAERGVAAAPRHGANRDLIDEVVSLTVPIRTVVETIARITGDRPDSLRHSTKVAVLHAGADVVAGCVEQLALDRALFFCRREVTIGVTGRLSSTATGSRNVTVTAVAPRHHLREGAGFEVELRFSSTSGARAFGARLSVPRMEAVRAKRVLLIDDSEAVNKATAATLIQAGYFVKCVTNPFETYGCIQSTSPDLVLVDYNMPSLSGDRLIGMSKRSGVTVPMVLFSSSPEAVLQQAMARCGAVAYIQKNHRAHVLVSKIDAVFQQIGWSGDAARSARS